MTDGRTLLQREKEHGTARVSVRGRVLLLNVSLRVIRQLERYSPDRPRPLVGYDREGEREQGCPEGQDYQNPVAGVLLVCGPGVAA